MALIWLSSTSLGRPEGCSPLSEKSSERNLSSQFLHGVSLKLPYHTHHVTFYQPLLRSFFYENKNLPALRAHSHRALRAQLASLASLSAPRARDLIVALRAPFFLDLALRTRSCALRIHLTLH